MHVRVSVKRMAFVVLVALLAACGNSDEVLSNKQTFDAELKLEHAPRISAEESESQAIVGAVWVLRDVPVAREDVNHGWFIGPEWTQWSQSSANLSIHLKQVRLALCNIRAAEIDVRGFDYCGDGSYFPDTGRLLASGAAPLGQGTSRDFLLKGLDDAESYARRALRRNCPALIAALQADTKSPVADREASLREYRAYCAEGRSIGS